MNRRIVGCMTGTSMDGIDAALIEVTGKGLGMQAKFIAGVSRPLDTFEDKFQSWSRGESFNMKEFTSLSRKFGEFHVDVIKELIDQSKVDLISTHGQTIFHKPPDTMQLLNPFPIASHFEVPVVYDLRQMDVCSGGEGAPLTPIADGILFREHLNSVVINGGGFCNVTYVGKNFEDSNGFDLCVCNLLLNQICISRFHQPFDLDGHLAKTGEFDQRVFEIIKENLMKQKVSGRSLGSDDEMRSLLATLKDVSGQNLLFSACKAIAFVIAERVQKLGNCFILAGGGFNHPVLKSSLIEILDQKNIVDIDFDILKFREAIGFAILGGLCQDRVPITNPKIHHSQKTLISGAWVLP